MLNDSAISDVCAAAAEQDGKHSARPGCCLVTRRSGGTLTEETFRFVAKFSLEVNVLITRRCERAQSRGSQGNADSIGVPRPILLAPCSAIVTYALKRDWTAFFAFSNVQRIRYAGHCNMSLEQVRAEFGESDWHGKLRWRS